MKLLSNFYLTIVKRKFFLFLRAGEGAFYGLKNKKIYNENNLLYTNK